MTNLSISADDTTTSSQSASRGNDSETRDPIRSTGSSRPARTRSDPFGSIWSSIHFPFLNQRRSGSSNHRHRHNHHGRRRRMRFKQRERNFLAAVCSMVVIVTLSSAMAAPNWFYLRGGGCQDKMSNPVHTLSVYQFFYMGHFTEEVTNGGKGDVSKMEYRFSPDASDVLVNCVSPRVAQVMRSIISLCFIGIAFSLMAFFLDLAGPTSRLLKILRRNAVFNILTVMVCVTINGFSFMITQLLESLQNDTKSHHYSKVEVQFDVSFYLVAGAGGMSVIAAACNLLRRPTIADSLSHTSSEQREHLLEDYDGMEPPILGPQPDYYAPMNYMPPPPAYTP